MIPTESTEVSPHTTHDLDLLGPRLLAQRPRPGQNLGPQTDRRDRRSGQPPPVSPTSTHQAACPIGRSWADWRRPPLIHAALL